MSSVGNMTEGDLKRKLQSVGLYEEGMSTVDMVSLYDFVEQSERCANQEEDYRSIMSCTEKNCADIEKLTDQKTEINENVKPNSEELANHNLIASYDSEDEQESQEQTMEINTNKFILPDLFSDNNNSILLNKSMTNESPTNINKTDTLNAESNNVIDVFSLPGNSYKPFNLKSPANSLCPLYNHHTFLKMSYNEKIRIICQFNMLQVNIYKKHQRRSINKALWGKTLTSDSFDHLKDAIAENSKTDKVDGNYTNVTSENTSVDAEENSRMSHRLRPIKRKTYSELSDEENDCVSKKRKDRKLGNKSATAKNNVERVSENNNSKTNATENVISSSTVPDGSQNRLNKIFDNLRKNIGDNNGRCSSSDDDILPNTYSVTAEVHEENTSANKTTVPERVNEVACKDPESNDLIKNRLKLFKANNYDEILIDNQVSNIPAQSFYEKTTSENENVRTINKIRQKLPVCPICQKSFSKEVILIHASQCTEFGESSKSPDEASTNINLEVRQDPKLPAAENIKQKNVTKSSDYLCSICDTYVLSANINEHSRNCIMKELSKKK